MTTTPDHCQPDFRAGTWRPGDRVKYHGSKPPAFLDVKPGLYWYSGFGSGTLFRADGTMMMNCSPQEAGRECDGLGLTFRYVDSFDMRSIVNVSD